MSFPGPKLPGALLDKVQGGRISKSKKQPSRKEQRKAERTAKKSAPRTKPLSTRSRPPLPAASPPISRIRPTQAPSRVIKPVKSQESKPALKAPQVKPKSRVEEAEDDEIAALEKKLGLNKKKTKKIGDEELDWLVFGSDGEDDGATSKRKRPEDDDWLQKKRRKATRAVDEELGSDESEDEDASGLDIDFDDSSDSDGDDGNENDDDGTLDDEGGGEMLAEGSEAEFGGFDEESESEDVMLKKPRENPYIAPPVSDPDAPVAKYVPPSMRKAATSDDEILSRLRRQLQGLLNRLSEDNILSILQSIQDVYASNARQHVTATLIELLRDRICDPSTLNDTFLILHAGFAAALYRAIGTDFGAQLLESLVDSFKRYHCGQDLSGDQNQTLLAGKQTLNIIAFLSSFYVLQAISSAIIFDYLRILLDRDNFSEANTELLLRIIRVCGTQLRQDDPSALKDIVMLLQKTVSALGEDDVSVRTKFMIETIHNLKNNRMKTGLAASALSAEHTQRMRKTLGSIKSAKATEPLRISMADLQDSDKKGKWWLVGASWRDPAKMAPANVSMDDAAHNGPSSIVDAEDAESDSDVDLNKLARAQGMNTDVRRALFVAVAGAVDFEHAYLRIMKLNLKSKQQLEIPQVLLHCVGAEPVYNHFYSLVATKFCRDHKMRKAYQFALLDLCRSMGEKSGDTEDDEDNDEDDSLGARKLYNLAKLYATLIAEGLLRLTILKHLDFADLQAKTRIFVSLLLSTVFVLLRKKCAPKPKSQREAEYARLVNDTYMQAHAAPGLISGLRYFITVVLPEADVAANAKEAQVISSGTDCAVEALTAQPPNRPMLQDDDTSEGDD